ncbi:MAG: RNA polymerase sigma factor RpoD/SigA [Armatimonadota bacterium]|nr:RNA polymerase sigma factor RpoD/SigA [Armatimonadota bacterium]MDR7439195.1 RNA polymerase sigma factor RpoD/SigA [Armatimonadota bacterium]MDR7562783.1 RNA polymerase sigma factor RpoD/SigA [Armatimonadota bacterium]MDR7568183.1 RNA polymerase sigma factor RpoD/SigA [Armatimonadota bacterium]MDR7600904.1 RNA polymerase sigma factor RpoD/SigA [Armatimonadota bacterium]
MRSGSQHRDQWLRTYLNRVSRSPRLTREEEERLGRQIQSGDKDALRALVEAHLYLVVSLARRFARLGGSLLDLIQEGNLALVEAAARFDGRRGRRFSTYAVWWVRHALQRALLEQHPVLHLPTYRRRELVSLRREQRILAQRLGREPTPQEIARCLGWPLKRVLQDLPLLEAPVSLEALIPDDDFEKLLPALEAPDPDEALVPRMRREVLQQLLERLPERERAVIRLRYGLDGEPPRTMREVGRRLGLTAEGVRQVELRALAKLRRSAWLARLRDLAG